MENQTKNPYENPFIQMLSRIGELMIVNFLFVVCCLPIFTIGAAAAGLNKVTQNIVLDAEGGVFKTFFRGFRENFKQATVLWLCEAVVIIALVCYWLIICTFCTGTLRTVLNALLFVVALLLLCVAVYLIPLMVRYENGMRQHLKNAALLSIIKLPRTVGMVLMTLIMPAILYISVPVFIQTTFFWLIMGFAVISYLCGILLKPVFTELEESPDGHTGIGIMN